MLKKNMAVIPKTATTVILLREQASEGFEVFLVKRHEKNAFFGGNFVYPGGRVDEGDSSSEIFSLCKGVSLDDAWQALGCTSSKEKSLACWVAGIRELFEEVGVLFAYDKTGNLFSMNDVAIQQRFFNYRNLLHDGKVSFGQIAREENLSFALDQLHYYAHWITPEARSIRFDAYFFLACNPGQQEASPDRREITEGIWITPERALNENLKGALVLSPPTLKTLEDLSSFRTTDHLFASLREKENPAILPVLTHISGETFLVFPWDPEYEKFKTGELDSLIDHGRPSGPSDNATRLILKEGRWLPYVKDSE
jgi:8-oxo-dGTP pyrophosphatase MutT (NUDIX family)